MESSAFMKYFLNKKSYNQNLQERFIETDFFGLSFAQGSPQRYEGLVIQVLYSTFYFDQQNVESLRRTYNRNVNPEDFYYYLTFTINKSFTTRSSLVKLKKYTNDIVYLEFNKQFTFNSKALKCNFQEEDIFVTINLIPIASFEGKEGQDAEFFVDYLFSQKIAYCLLNFKTFEQELISENLRANPINKLLVNCAFDETTIEPNRLIGREFNVGCDFYVLEEIDYSYLEKMKSNPNVDERIKNLYWNIRFDNHRNILLRFPRRNEFLKVGKHYNEEILIQELIDNNSIEKGELKSILENRQFLFLPYVHRLNEKNVDLENGHLDYDDLLKIGYKQGDWVTKVQKFKKYFPAKLLGISENYNVYYKNYVTNEIKCAKLNIHDYKEIITNFKPVQENLFSIYDLDEIEPSMIENNSQYKWKIMLKFPRKESMEAFLYFLKDLRRKANFRLVSFK
jgi:hypothetical protein